MTAAPEPQASRRARFRAVYDANYHRVLGYVLRRAATREDAEDVVAETFLTAWRRLEEVPRGGGARPSLYGVARNALANQRRGQRRRGRLWGRLQAEPAPAAWHGAKTDDELAPVAAAYERLKAGDRELLALAAWEERIRARSRRCSGARETRPGSGFTGPAGGWRASCSARTPVRRAGRWSRSTPSGR